MMVAVNAVSTLDRIKDKNASLHSKFSSTVEVNTALNRKLVSFQANKTIPVFRWFKYKEGFSAPLLYYIFRELGVNTGKVLDPFAGIGTTLFVARELGLDSLGIELLSIGCEIINAGLIASDPDSMELVSELRRWQKERLWMNSTASIDFPHITITKGAFPKEAEKLLCQYLALADREPEKIRRMLRFAAICILEEISFTRKDGQYLRWDYRSGRTQGSKPFDKGAIIPFNTAIDRKLSEICEDIITLNAGLLSGHRRLKAPIELEAGTCLEIMPKQPNDSFDCLITSPPYCNRYDYTRTYALELALLGVGEDEIKRLRQTMLSCTVENREKVGLVDHIEKSRYETAKSVFDSQDLLNVILNYLDYCKEAKLLNNNGIARMVRNYFWEMTLFIFEAVRLLKPGAPLIMVNDNVRYVGVNIPVDLILSDIAHMAGFEVEKIWILPNGKGNSSQQMGKHGREELRKSIYVWRASKEQSATKLNP
jgi:hypothetical protein